jgi:flagellar hook-basal body complex protein FliE
MQIQNVMAKSIVQAPQLSGTMGVAFEDSFSAALDTELNMKQSVQNLGAAMARPMGMVESPGAQDVVNFVAQLTAEKKWEQQRIQEFGEIGKEDLTFAQLLPELEGDVRNQIGTIGVPQSEALTPQSLTELSQRQNRLETTPFQLFLDKAVDFFLRVSDQERHADMLMVDYVEGRISLEELMIEKSKAGVAVSFSLTLVNQVTQTFKEIQNMQV